MAETPIAPALLNRTSLAVHYNSILGQRGFQLAPHHYPIILGIEDDRIPMLAAIGPPGYGKSLLVDIAAPTWFVGNDPTMTVLGVSAGEKLVGTFLRASMEIIQFSPHFCELYPTVRPDMQAGWSTERGLFVTGRAIGDQDASYFAAGLKSKALTGVHARRILLDDLHDEANSMTPEMRQDVKDTYYKTLLGRADPRGCRFIATGRRWATDDIYGMWAESGDWVILHIPSIREVPKAPGSTEMVGSKQLWIDVYVPRDLTCVYTETLKPAPPEEQNSKAPWLKYRAYYGFDPTGVGFYWPASDSKRREVMAVKRGKPLVFETVYQGRPEAGQEQVFLPTDFIPYAPPGNLSLGLADPDTTSFVRHGRGHVAQAWDTAMGQQLSAAVTAGLTGLLLPCNHWHKGEDPQIVGPCEYHFDVWLLDLFAENVDFKQLVQTIRSQNLKWNPRRVIVEEKVSGISLLQTLRGTEVPLYPVKVTEGKIERAVNGVGGGAASVQGWCRLGRVHYPVGMPWVENWLSKMLNFAGDAGQRADEFDATVHLITYAILRSRQTGRMASNVFDEDTQIPTDATGLPQTLPVQQAAATLGRQAGLGGLVAHLNELPAEAGNPFGAERCGAPCRNWILRSGTRLCALDGSRRMSLDSCGKFAPAVSPPQ